MYFFFCLVFYYSEQCFDSFLDRWSYIIGEYKGKNMKCPNCGSEYNQGEQSCSKCGIWFPAIKKQDDAQIPKKVFKISKFFEIVNLSAILVFATIMFAVFYSLAPNGKIYAMMALVFLAVVDVALAILILGAIFKIAKKHILIINFGNVLFPLFLSFASLVYMINNFGSEGFSSVMIAFLFVVILGFVASLGFVFTGFFTFRNFPNNRKTLQILFALFAFITAITFTVFWVTVVPNALNGIEGFFEINAFVIGFVIVLLGSGIASIFLLKE